MMSSTDLNDDLTLIIDDEELQCSRELLTKCSEYFRAMFCSNMKETKASSIVIRDVSLRCMKWLVNYSKDSSKHKFDDVYDACDILHTACILQCLEVIEIASKYIITRLSAKNCLSVMCIADLHALNHLYNVSRRKALWDFLLVRTTPEFFSRGKDCLMDYLSCDMLNTPNEELVLESAIQWIEYDLDNRKDVFHAVLSCVRLADVGSALLKPYLVRPSVMSNENIQLTIAKAVDSELASTSSRKLPCQLWVTGEWHPTPPAAQNSKSKLVCVHGGLDQMNKFELLDNLPINNPHPRANGRATERAGFTVTVVGKDLYIMGGGSVSSSKLHPDCWRYDTFRGVWTDVGDMPIPRRHHSTVLVAGRYLMLIGGFGSFRVMLDSVLCYDTVTGEWSEQAKLNSAEFSAAVCQCQDYVYVFKHQIQRLNIQSIGTGREGHWEEVRSALPFEIGMYSAVSVGEKIYILGQNICSLVCFDTRSLTFDTLATFQPYVQRLAPVLCLKNSLELLIVSRQKKDDEGVKTLVEEFDIKEKRVLKDYDLGWIISNPQAAIVPYYPNFR